MKRFAATPWDDDTRTPLARPTVLRTTPQEVEPDPEPEAQAPAPLAPPDEKAALRKAIGEYEAARARVERDAGQERDAARARLVADLLPVLDNLDRSLAVRGGTAGETGLRQGVQLVRAQLDGVLRGYGLERFDALGSRFDPREHEAIAMVEIAEPERDGLVVGQAQAGYRIGGLLLRPARVQVGRLPRRGPW